MKQIKVKNVVAHVVIIGTSKQVIAPGKIVEVDGDDKGVQDMLRQRKLITWGEQSEATQPPTETTDSAPDDSAPDSLNPYKNMTVAQLKELLQNQGVSVGGSMSKRELLDLVLKHIVNGSENREPPAESVTEPEQSGNFSAV